MDPTPSLKSLHLARIERTKKRLFEGPGVPFQCPKILLDSIHTTLTLYSTPGEAIGSIIWSGSGALIEYLAEHSSELTIGKRILEVGCGVGVAGLCCASGLKAAEVVLTDVASLCDLPQHNVNVNALAHKGSARVCPLDWGEESAWEEFLTSNPQFAAGGLDTIVGSDVVYTQQGAKALGLECSADGAKGDHTIYRIKRKTP